eukprot:1180139-Prorocentrum_minimum.AAC.2
MLQTRQVMYHHNHNKPMSCPAMAQLLSNTLYYKRFFPYYTFNILGGLDNEGKGAVYTYDAIGSYERTGYSCQGSGQALIMPILDNQLKAISPLVMPMTVREGYPNTCVTIVLESQKKKGECQLVIICLLFVSFDFDLAWTTERCPRGGATPLSEEEAIDLVKDCFATAGERDIYTGDTVEIFVVNSTGVHLHKQALKLD